MGRECRLVVLTALLWLSVGAVLGEDDVCSGRAKAFIVGFSPHTGSTAIMSTLYQHLELMVNRTREVQVGHGQREQMVERWSNEARTKGLVSGLKIPSKRLLEGRDMWTAIAEKHRTRFIALIRTNAFLTAIGHYRVWISMDDQSAKGISKQTSEEYCQEHPNRCRFEVRDLRLLALFMRQALMVKFKTMEVSSAVPWACRLDVTYEEYDADPDGTMDRIYDFLGVSRPKLPPMVRKVLSDNACAILTNYQEVCAALWGCPQFRPFLEDASKDCICRDKTRLPTKQLCGNPQLLLPPNGTTPSSLSSLPKTDLELGVQKEEGECVGRAKTFLMGCVGHTGSSAIISSLYQHSEIVNQRPFEPLRKVMGVGAQVRAADAIFEKASSTDLVSGLKMRPEHMTNGSEEWQDLAQKYDTRFISLTRNNTFLTALGLYSIRAMKHSSATMGLKQQTSAKEHCEENPEMCYFSIDDIRFFAYLMLHAETGNRRTQELASRVPWSCRFDLTYEEYVADPVGMMGRIHDFLGVRREVHHAAFTKAMPSVACDIVTNYQEVCAKLWGCPNFRPFLEDPANGCFCEDKTRPVTEELCDEKRLARSRSVICIQTDATGEKKEVPCSLMEPTASNTTSNW